MTSPVRIQDDLFQAVNGEWLAHHEIPADRARDGAFHQLRDLSEERVRTIVERCAEQGASAGAVAANEDTGDNRAEAEKIGRLYRAFMDTDTIEAAGLAPLAEQLAAIRDAESPGALGRVLGSLTPTGGSDALPWGVMSDLNDPTRYALYFGQGGLGLPDESYYREDAHAETRDAYVRHVAALARLADLDADPEGFAQRVFRVETALAGGHRDRVTARDIHKSNNPRTRAEVGELLSPFPFEEWADAAGLGERELANLIVMMPEYCETLARIWRESDLVDLKAWAVFHLVHANAPYLTQAIVEENFEMYGRTLTGAESLRERWKRGVGVVESALGEAVGQLYVAEYFPPEHKDAIDALVANLIEAYRRSITDLDWMTAETKKRALDKLDAFTPKVGYPDRWRDYSPLEIPEGDLIGGVWAARAFEFAREIGKLGGPIDRDEWLMTPQTVNAYYMPTQNEIVFPAAILQPPFFDPDGDDAAAYGGIGAVIGHEIGHGFDDQGSQFDGSGLVDNWWTDTDRERFEERTRALIEQYDDYVPSQLGEESTHHVNGALTIGENIGDLGGLSIALKAYAIALAKRGETFETAPTLDGHTALQRVFLAWARIWREKARDEEIIRLLTIDPHSPAEFRCNGVPKNIDAFYEAFDVQRGDGMWLEPEQRVSIW
ncbi:MAG: M13-type metalloendopeptidase [Bowdeniella nasicola]|nr:M13-type metalloendopeptidase [Bowdeniella nasicola]